jgi:hypothetical protein
MKAGQMKVGQVFRPHNKFIGSFIPNSLMRCKDVSDGAKLCYGRLSQFKGKEGDAFPSHETLGKELGVSRDTAKRRVKELERLKLIKIKHVTGSSNRYDFLWHEIFNEKTKTKVEDVGLCPKMSVKV